MLIDSHAHVNFRAYKEDAKEVIDRALSQDTWVVNIGSQIDTSREAVEMANSYEKGVYAVVGLHPEHTHSQYVDEEESHFLSREEHFNYEEYKKLATNPKVVGIGECGLDYYRLPENVDEKTLKEKQKAAFRQQVKLALELNKALVIHSRPSKDSEALYDDLLEILDDVVATTPSALTRIHPSLERRGSSAATAGVPASPPDEGQTQAGGVPRAIVQGGGGLRFVVHSFTGSPEAAQKFLDRGGYISFNGIITFDKTGNMEKLVKMTPLDRMLLETDCPYLTPVPHRGKRNEPAYVSYVAQKVAEIKGVGLDEVQEKTFANTSRLFGI